MHGAHLRLEAVRVEVARPAGPWAASASVPAGAPVADSSPAGVGLGGGVWDWWKPMSRRSRAALALDRRVTALTRASGLGEALVGFAILPWCDVTLWSVPGSAGDLGVEDGGTGCEAPARQSAQASARLRVELAHVDWALAYVEQLPVREALASKPWRWRWSSAPWHCGFGLKPAGLAPEWTGPARSDLWRERLAGAFVDRSDRSVDLVRVEWGTGTVPQRIDGSAVDRLARRQSDHSPGMPSGTDAPATGCTAIDPSQGELAVA